MKPQQVRILFTGHGSSGVLVCRRSQVASAIADLHRRGYRAILRRPTP